MTTNSIAFTNEITRAPRPLADERRVEPRLTLDATPRSIQFRAGVTPKPSSRTLGVGARITFGAADRCDFTTGSDPSIAEQLHGLSAEGRTDAATQLAFREAERCLSSRRFSELDALLGALKPEGLLSEVIVAILALTRFEREEMPSRASFLAAAEASLRARLGADRAERLLASRR